MSGETNPKRIPSPGPTEGRPARSRARAARTSSPTPVPITVEGGPAPELLPHHRKPAVATIPEVLPRLLRTEAAYRQLIMSGMTGAEAAGLIGYVSGLPANVSPWTMAQVNRLLFLRSLYLESRWGESERQPAKQAPN